MGSQPPSRRRLFSTQRRLVANKAKTKTSGDPFPKMGYLAIMLALLLIIPMVCVACLGDDGLCFRCFQSKPESQDKNANQSHKEDASRAGHARNSQKRRSSEMIQHSLTIDITPPVTQAASPRERRSCKNRLSGEAF